MADGQCQHNPNNVCKDITQTSRSLGHKPRLSELNGHGQKRRKDNVKIPLSTKRQIKSDRQKQKSQYMVELIKMVLCVR